MKANLDAPPLRGGALRRIDAKAGTVTDFMSADAAARALPARPFSGAGRLLANAQAPLRVVLSAPSRALASTWRQGVAPDRFELEVTVGAGVPVDGGATDERRLVSATFPMSHDRIVNVPALPR